MLSRYLNYETSSRRNLIDYGRVVSINGDGTVNINVEGYNLLGQIILLEKVAVKQGYTPKIGDYVSFAWENNKPVITGAVISSTLDLTDYSTIINTPTQVASGTIIGEHIQANTITGSHIQAGTITASNIAVGTITAESGIIADAAITTAKIQDLAVTNIKIADASISEAKIQDLAVTNAKIADLAVTDAKIQNLDASKIISGDISTDRLKTNVIEAINLSTSLATIDGAKITDATITDAKIQNLDASKIISGDITTDRLKANVIEAINLSTSTAVIDQAKIGNLDASKITTGTLQAGIIASSVIEAINLSATGAVINQAKIGNLDASKITSGEIDVDRLKGKVIEAVNLSTTGAVISQAKIQDLDASKIVSGNISAARMQAHVIDAVNLSTSTAVIDQAKIGNLDASKITSGDINALRMRANVVDAINLSTSQAVIDQAKIGNLDASKITSGDIDTNRLVANVINAINFSAQDTKIDGARIAQATITDAHISNLSANKITTGDLNANVMATNVINAINISSSLAVIDAARIGELDADKITSGTISAERIKGSVIEAINLSTSLAKIDSAKIQDLDASKIVSGDISTDRLKANVINAINLSTSTATIDGARITDATITNAKIVNIDASKISSGDIATDRLKANVIDAINLSASSAVINQAKISDLSANKITSGTIDTSKVTISTSASGTGARLEFVSDGIYMRDASNNVMARLTNQGFVVHVPGGIKLDNQGSIRLGPTEDIVIDSQGMKAKAGGTDYTAYFTAEGLKFIDPINISKQLIINSGQLKITTDGGLTYRTALTADGFYGNILVDNTLPASKFDTTPPAIPTWRGEGLTAVLEQTAETQIVSITVKWNQVNDTDLEGYKIYLEENNSGSYYPIAIVGKTNEYKIRAVKPNTTYKVKITSFDVQGNECSTQLPSDILLTTYPKTIVTPKDTIAPATPLSSPVVVSGFKMFAVSWNEITTNVDGSSCYDLDYYEVQRSTSQDWNLWETVATIRGTSLIDKEVEYEVEYKYRYRAVDVSGNSSGWSPEVYAGKPSKVGSGDIVAHSITSEHISTVGLSADIITSGKIRGDLIEANTITADKFESTLHGDIVQALRYVETRLRQKLYEWIGTNTNYATCLLNDVYVYNNTLMLDTVYHWDETGVSWDTSYNWDKPVVTSGYLESPILDIGQLYTMLVIYRMSYSSPPGSSIKVYLRSSEDNITWTSYTELKGDIITARYIQFKIELTVENTDSNIFIDSFALQCYVDDQSVIDASLKAHKSDFNNPHHVQHSQTNPLEVNETDISPTKDKHISNLLAKQWEDHRLSQDLATHGNTTNQSIIVGGLSSNGDIVLSNLLRLKQSSGVLEIRNSADSDYADLTVKNLTIKGNTTTIESEILQIADNVLTLNSNYTGSSPTENAGIEVNRGTLTKASLIWDESNDVWKAGLAGSEQIIWTAGTDGSGSGLDACLLDGQHASYFAPASHNHDSVYLKLIGGTLSGALNLNNNNITGVNHIQIADPGANEGIEWVGGNGWKIFESPNDLTSNISGNLQVVQGTSRRATFNTSGQLEIPVATGTAPFVISSTTKVINLNVDLVDDCHVGNSANNILKLDASGLVPLSNIPNALTGKDADTLDGYHSSAFETPSGAQSKVDTHAASKQTHGIASPYYIAKTSRSDQLPDWADLQGKPTSSVANIDDAVNKRHTQNTDNTLTNSAANIIDTTGTGNIVDFKVNSVTKSSIDNSGNFTGNATTASRLQTARTISLSGDVSGSASFDGSSDIIITTTVVDSSHNHDASNITSGTLPSGRITSNQGSYTTDPNFPKTNTTHSTLGGATIGEIALCPAYVSNKLQFVLPTTIEYTTDGVTWLAYPDAVDSTIIKNMFLGYNAGGSIRIRGPNNGNWQKLRIVFTSPAYVYLDYFYMYQSTSGHICNILIERSYGAEVDNYSQVATGNFSGWPGHTLVPHSTIPWHPNPTPGTHSRFVRITFTPTWNASYPSNDIYIYNINWYGGYPANTRPELYTWDFDKKTTFPNDIYVNTNKVWHAGNDGTGSGLDSDLLDGLHASAFSRAQNGAKNIWVQSTAPTAIAVGDIWIQT